MSDYPIYLEEFDNCALNWRWAREIGLLLARCGRRPAYREEVIASIQKLAYWERGLPGFSKEREHALDHLVQRLEAFLTP